MGNQPFKISLYGAVVMIVGTVIGAGIYIMIGPIAVATGPGLFLCYLFALATAITSSLCYAQVASVFPATAGTYQYVKMFYSDTMGYLIGWLRLISTFFGLALMGIGFAHYITAYWIVDKRLIAAAVISVFYITNLLGIKTTQRVQNLLVTVVVSGLVGFCIAGVSKISSTNLTPLLQAGIGPVIRGSMTAFYAYTGLYIVAEIGDEIQNPRENIPKSIIIASTVVGILYIVASLVFSGALGWAVIRTNEPNLAQASKLLFGYRLAAFIQVSAIMAIMAPMNATYITSSRFLYSLALDGIMPPIFSKLNRFGVPGNAITVNYLLALSIIFADLSILFLGTISSIVILFAMSLVAGACLKIKKRYPEEFDDAPFKLSKGMLGFLPFYTIISAALLIIISFTQDLLVLFSLMFWTILGIGYYYAKGRRLKKTKIESIK